MSNNMKLIMENWRHSALQEQEAKTAREFVDRIKLGLVVLAAKTAGKEALKQLATEIGPELLDAGLDMVKALPGVGNAVSTISSLWKAGKATAKGILATKEVAQAAFDVMKVAANNYVEAEDDQISDGNPLAVLFGIDDIMEVPLKPAFLTNFAGTLLKFLQNKPDMVIDDPNNFAEKMLAQYINKKGHLSSAKPPRK